MISQQHSKLLCCCGAHLPLWYHKKTLSSWSHIWLHDFVAKEWCCLVLSETRTLPQCPLFCTRLMRKTYGGLSNNTMIPFSAIQRRNPSPMGFNKALPKMFRVRVSAFQHRQDFYYWYLWEESYASGEDIAQKALSSSENRWAHFYTSYIYCLIYRSQETSRIKVKTQLESTESKIHWNNKQASSFLRPNSSINPKQFSAETCLSFQCCFQQCFAFSSLWQHIIVWNSKKLPVHNERLVPHVPNTPVPSCWQLL